MDDAGMVSEELVVGGAMVEPVPMHWSPVGRVGFRMAFIFFFCFIFLYGNGTILSIYPVVGPRMDKALTWPTNRLTELVAVHVFHLAGLAAKWHPTGSGDTAMNWIENGIFVFYAVVGGLVWTLIARLRGSRRTEYRTLYAWLRFGLRLTIGMQMLGYGLAKLFPHQMPPISIAVLNEPVGNSSPMTLLWSLIGMNPAYEMVCGFAEVMGGALLLFRRTALMGALLSAFVMANVVLYNLFFDVPVKLFAGMLLLASLFVVLPDVPALFAFFWLHRPVAPAGVWAPPVSRKGFRIATRVVEVVSMVAFMVAMPIFDGIGWWKDHTAREIHTPLEGAWKVDAGQKATGAFVTGEGLPATDLYIDTVRRAFTRASDGALWRTYLTLDDKAHAIKIRDFPGEPVLYEWTMTDGEHLRLTSKPDGDAENKAAFVAATVTLTRTAIPAHYPLLDRGFHWVNEWGLER